MGTCFLSDTGWIWLNTSRRVFHDSVPIFGDCSWLRSCRRAWLLMHRRRFIWPVRCSVGRGNEGSQFRCLGGKWCQLRSHDSHLHHYRLRSGLWHLREMAALRRYHYLLGRPICERVFDRCVVLDLFFFLLVTNIVRTEQVGCRPGPLRDWFHFIRRHPCVLRCDLSAPCP